MPSLIERAIVEVLGLHLNGERPQIPCSVVRYRDILRIHYYQVKKEKQGVEKSLNNLYEIVVRHISLREPDLKPKIKGNAIREMKRTINFFQRKIATSIKSQSLAKVRERLEYQEHLDRPFPIYNYNSSPESLCSKRQIEARKRSVRNPLKEVDAFSEPEAESEGECSDEEYMPL